MNKKRGNDHIQADCISGVNTNLIRDNLDTNTGNDVPHVLLLHVSFVICMLTLLLMPVAGLHFCVGLCIL
jgi:hypothetical protein